MRTFVVSDLHGNGEVYDSIMAYLDNMSLFEDVELYINGDLIDRGIDSMRMLDDVMKRSLGKGKVQIHYLGGNHELMMYQAYLDMKKTGHIDHFGPWISNGGWMTEGELDAYPIEEADQYYEFVGTLNIYKKFTEEIQKNKILLVHSMPPKMVYDECHLIIKDNTPEIEDCVWKREEEYGIGFFTRGPFLGYNNLGKKGYFVLRGHTPLKDEPFHYNPEQNWMNIDGGCARYATGNFEADHVPLVEISNDLLPILVFNHNNEIISGYYFDGNVYKMPKEDLEKSRMYLCHQYDNCAEKGKKLIKEIIEIEQQ